MMSNREVGQTPCKTISTKGRRMPLFLQSIPNHSTTRIIIAFGRITDILHALASTNKKRHVEWKQPMPQFSTQQSIGMGFPFPCPDLDFVDN
jgi:hypothetical protein